MQHEVFLEECSFVRTKEVLWSPMSNESKPVKPQLEQRNSGSFVRSEENPWSTIKTKLKPSFVTGKKVWDFESKKQQTNLLNCISSKRPWHEGFSKTCKHLETCLLDSLVHTWETLVFTGP